MFDRAWLPNLAVEPTFDWKLANSSAMRQSISVPVGFPESIAAEMVWEGAKFQGQPELYRFELSKEHVEEVEDAAAEVEGKQPD